MLSKQRTRRKFTAEQKAAILKRLLVDKVPVSALCDEYQLQPSLFYEWQRKLLENAERVACGGRAGDALHVHVRARARNVRKMCAWQSGGGPMT